MKYIYKVKDRKGERNLAEDDFPLVIGGGAAAHIELEALPEGAEAAYIGLAQDRPFVRAGTSEPAILYNRQKLEGSVWLFHGDTLQIASAEIVFTVEGPTLFFQVAEPKGATETQPAIQAADLTDAYAVEPIPFLSRRRSRHSKSWTALRWSAWMILGLMLIALAASAWFVFTAKQVEILIDPAPDAFSITGGILHPRLGSYYLMRPGEYSLRAGKTCYLPLERDFQITPEKSQKITFSMEAQPGLISLKAHQTNQPSVKLDGARITIDGEEVGTTPIAELKVKQGRRRLDIRAENYQDFTTDITVEGCGQLQSFDFALAPGWSDIRIVSVPQGAGVRINGQPFGTTPLQVQLPAGTHQLEIGAERFKSYRTQLVVQPDQPQVLDTIRLQPADATLRVRTNPSGANVMIDKTYIGQTPLQTEVAADGPHVILLAKPGYEKVSRRIQVPAAGTQELNVDLTPQKGVIRFDVEPADAELWVNGKLWGKVPRELRLIAVAHRLEFRKDGYVLHGMQITPQPGFPQELKIALERRISQKSGPAEIIEAKNGYVLKLIPAQAYTMGSSRREQGRRSNETLRSVELRRPFYMGVKEVTNKEFREFLTGHSSGSFKQQSLNHDDQPVVEVSWEQAAMFCNWLSARESLPPAYIRKGDTMVAAQPLPIGYRLPTEAEWEYCARFGGRQALLKYSWGNGFPPPDRSGNFADISAKDLLNSYLENYNDGYPVTSPPAKFKAGELGLYDLGGNVAEWCHDVYSIYPYEAKKVYLDPIGPERGQHHVVRDSSWKQGGISALRLTYRDYGSGKRDDLGFRVCRYLE